MNKLIILALALFGTSIAFAGPSWKAESVDASDVPGAVRSAHESHFSGTNLREWKRQTLATKDGSYSAYIAIFKDGSQNWRARYKETGEAVSAYTFHFPKKAPADIAEAAQEAHPDYALKSVEEFRLLQKDVTLFKTSLRKGGSRVIAWFDEDGDMIDANNIPDDLLNWDE